MSTSRSMKRKLADFSFSYDNIQSTSCETLLVSPSFTLDVNSSPPEIKKTVATSTPLSDYSSGESLEEIIEAYNKYTSTLSIT